jgi:hypothetical protein
MTDLLARQPKLQALFDSAIAKSSEAASGKAGANGGPD